MTVDDLKKSLGVSKDKDLATRLNRSKGTISKWRSKGIPKQSKDLIEAVATHSSNTPATA